MKDGVTEALLEMHFFNEKVKFFEYLYEAKYLGVIKPSPQDEKWVGFDQGWVKTKYDTKSFFDKLTNAIKSGKSTKINKFYIGYFFQYKKVEIMKTKRTPYFPTPPKAKPYETPYYRVELSLKPNDETKLSQHETLLRLKDIKNAHVFYACGMVFNLDDIYTPDLGKLRLVPLKSCTKNYPENERHFITFRTPNDLYPYWNSKPIKGEAFSFEDIISNKHKYGDFEKLTGNDAKNLVLNSAKVLHINPYESNEINKFPTSMRILEFEQLVKK